MNLPGYDDGGRPDYALCLDDIPVLFGAPPTPLMLDALEPLGARLSVEPWEGRPYPLKGPDLARSLRLLEEEVSPLLEAAGWV